MKRLIPAILALFCLALVACNSSPRAQLIATSDGFNAARKIVLDLHKNDIISDEQLVELDKVEKVGRGALDVAFTQVDTPGEPLDQWLAIARGSLAELAKVYGGDK